MTLLWAESFDLYGSGASGNTQLQLRGCVIAAPTLIQMALTTDASAARTGTGYMLCSTGGANEGNVYRQTDMPLNVCGMGVGFKITNSPSGLALHGEQGIRFGISTAIWGGINIVANEELGFSIYNSTTFIGKTTPNQIVVGSWYWLEARVVTGSPAFVELRINGNTVLTVSGFNFVGPMQRIGFGKLANSPGKCQAAYDDWIIWDDGGTENNNFLGERRCVTSYPSANASPQDWTPSAGSAFSCINESVPSSAEYIEADSIGDISEFAKQSIGISTSDIAALVVIARANKSDAGASEMKIGVHSGAFVTNTPNKVLSTSSAYFDGIFAKNPDGNVGWTRAAADAATIRFERAV